MQRATAVFRIEIDRERAVALGLTPGDVGRSIRNAVSGVVPTRYQTSWAEYDVRVRLPRATATNPDTLGSLNVHSGVSGPVLLRDVAAFTLGDSPAHIERENQGRILRVNGDIVVNNAILLVEYIESERAKGHSLDQSIIEAGGIRLRPILMTTLTTVAGMTPLALGMGAGANIMQPLALAVVGGLLSAMLLTLFVVPCLYLLVHRAGAALRRIAMKTTASD